MVGKWQTNQRAELQAVVCLFHEMLATTAGQDEAEKFAESDKEKREAVDVRNQADSMVYYKYTLVLTLRRSCFYLIRGIKFVMHSFIHFFLLFSLRK